MGVVGRGIVSARASAFTATSESKSKGAITLARIELPAFDGNPALILRLATRAYLDPDGIRWGRMLSEQPSIDHGGDWLIVGWQPVDAILTISDRRISGQARGAVFSDLFADYPFTSARIVIYQAFDNLVSTSEFEEIFTGEIAQVDSMDLEGILLHCVQDRDWSVDFPTRTVNLDDFPNAPTAAVGAVIPVVLGSWEAGRYLSDGVSEAATAGIARGAVPMLPIDAPTAAGVTRPKFLISDEEIDQGLLTGGAPYDEWYLYCDQTGNLAGPGIGTLSNPAGGPATLALLSQQVQTAIIPIDIDPSTTAIGAQECTRKDKNRSLDGYAELDWDLNQRILRLLLPDVSTPGKFVAATLHIWFSKNAWSGTSGKYIIGNSDLALATTANFVAGSTGFTSLGFESHIALNVGTNVIRPVAGDLDGWQDIKNCYIQCDVRATGQKLRINRAVLAVDFIAAAQVERPGTTRTVGGKRITVSGRTAGGANVGYRGLQREETSPDLVSFSASIYNFPRGPKDDSLGTYTGTPGALIEHPVDMVRYLLRRWSGIPSGQIVETPDQFGAFPDAKAELAGYKFRALFSRQVSLEEHIAQIESEALCSFMRTPTEPSSPFVAVPWNIGQPVNYRSAAVPFIFSRKKAHVVQGSFSAGTTRITLVANTVRVNYDWDPRTDTYGDQLYITPTRSRVYSGGIFTTDSGLEAAALDSKTWYKNRPELAISLKMVSDPATASSILSRLFALRSYPRTMVRFRTFVNAYDLNRGHVIGFSGDWDARLKYPRAGGDGTWEGKRFRVVSIQRLKESPIEYQVEAVEIETD